MCLAPTCCGASIAAGGTSTPHTGRLPTCGPCMIIQVRRRRFSSKYHEARQRKEDESGQFRHSRRSRPPACGPNGTKDCEGSRDPDLHLEGRKGSGGETLSVL